MANGDVDAINERLNGLVNLLQVVGIDGINTNTLMEEQRRNGASSRGGSAAPQSSSDVQILELIKKLQLAQADSPEILAALQSPELRALASLAAQKQRAAEPKKASPALDDVMDDDDNYPKIGPGYSDDVSVMSDMTTPTVMTRQQVPDEEHYREVNGGPGALPPLHALSGGPAQPARPAMGMIPMQRYGAAGAAGGGGKTKNMVGAVRAGQAHRAIPKSGGAAAQRRLNYQMAMTKLQSGAADPAPASPRKTQKEVFAPSSPTPSQQTPMEFPSMAEGSGGKNPKKGKEKLFKKTKKTALAAQEISDLDFEGTEPIRTPATSATSGSTGSSGGRKKSLTPVTNDVDWAMGDTAGWQAFDTGGGSSGKDIFVDNHGFFPNDAFGSNDPFVPTQTSSPTPSSKSRAKSPRQRPSSSTTPNGTVRKAVPSKKLSTGRLKKEGDAKRGERSEKTAKKKSRSRASLTM
ncbi:hypothetical protein IV203_038084 [Nitzschia inconspicua]|uniref:Uncharacterized protein n=1 Tax=Nitzschia inconspicua TaxID=303405 RepID=A0A9K3LQ54_9STRA|nr:hypothetical protein IV203_038084 [Nitzschia inconspicua]